jgi:hypothetical protein
VRAGVYFSSQSASIPCWLSPLGGLPPGRALVRLPDLLALRVKLLLLDLAALPLLLALAFGEAVVPALTILAVALGAGRPW